MYAFDSHRGHFRQTPSGAYSQKTGNPATSGKVDLLSSLVQVLFQGYRSTPSGLELSIDDIEFSPLCWTSKFSYIENAIASTHLFCLVRTSMGQEYQ